MSDHMKNLPRHGDFVRLKFGKTINGKTEKFCGRVICVGYRSDGSNDGSKVFLIDDPSYCKLVALDDIEYWEDRNGNIIRDLNNKEMEAEKTLKITAPEGYEIDKEKSTFENIVFKKKENPLPKSWEEFILKNDITVHYYIDNTGCARYYTCDKFSSANEFKTEEDAEEMIAFMKLRHLRDVYRQGWKPDWENDSEKYAIKVYDDSVEGIHTLRHFTSFLSFQTKEICEEFIENFKDLILKAKNLIG